jgi:phosphoribosylformylglycinamidine synthase
MLTLPGSAALSAFRLKKLLDTLQARDPRVQSLDARFVHFAQIPRSLTSSERSVLNALLTYGPRDETKKSDRGDLILVVPRPSTI